MGKFDYVWGKRKYGVKNVKAGRNISVDQITTCLRRWKRLVLLPIHGFACSNSPGTSGRSSFRYTILTIDPKNSLSPTWSSNRHNVPDSNVVSSVSTKPVSSDSVAPRFKKALGPVDFAYGMLWDLILSTIFYRTCSKVRRNIHET